MQDELVGFDLRLIEKMAERGMTQADLCRHTGLASSMISHYCTGQRIPSFPVVSRIAKALDTTVDFLAYGNTEKTVQLYPDNFAVAEKPKDYASSIPMHKQIEDEALLRDMYNSLNPEGKEKVIAYIKDICSIETYLQKRV